MRLVLGAVTGVDLDARHVTVRDPEDNLLTVGYDQLVVALGSVNKLLPVPGVTDTAHGFRSLAEAIYLRDHILRQLEIADVEDDPAEREARCTFVVVGAGYTGTEVAASGQLLTRFAAAISQDSAIRSSAGSWSTSRLASCQNSTRACRPSPNGCCRSGEWNSARARASSTPPTKA